MYKYNTDLNMSVDDFIRMLIINFMLEKKKLIDEFLGKDSKYVTMKDIEELQGWSNSDLSLVAMSLIKLVDSHDEITFNFGDADICPWCNLYNSGFGSRCQHCRYNRRNGNCLSDSKSRYKLISKSINKKLKEIYGCSSWYCNSPISHGVPGMEDLVKKYAILFKELVNIQ